MDFIKQCKEFIKRHKKDINIPSEPLTFDEKIKAEREKRKQEILAIVKEYLEMEKEKEKRKNDRKRKIKI